MPEYVKFSHAVDGIEVSRFGPVGFTCSFNVISEVTCSKDSERSVRRFWNELTPKDASNLLRLVSDETFDDLGLKSSSQWPLGKAEFERSLGSLLTSRINEHLQKMGFRKTSGDGNSFDIHVVVKEMGSAPPTPTRQKESVGGSILAMLVLAFLHEKAWIWWGLVALFVIVIYGGGGGGGSTGSACVRPSGYLTDSDVAEYLLCLKND